MRLLAAAASRFSRVVNTPLAMVAQQLRYTSVKTDDDEWNAELYSKNVDVAYKGGLPLIETLNPRPGERILDVGCGPGELTKVIQQSEVEVVGTDASLAMVEAAKEKGLDARHVDVYKMNFEEEFDAVFSRLCLPMMKRQEAALHTIRRSLKTGGRFVAQILGERHMNSVVEPLRRVFLRHGLPFSEHFPLYLTTCDKYKAILESQRFTVEKISPNSRQTTVAVGAMGWVDMYCQSLFVGVSDSEKLKLYAEIEQELDPKRTTEDGAYIGDYKLLSFVAKKHTTASAT